MQFVFIDKQSVFMLFVIYLSQLLSFLHTGLHERRSTELPALASQLLTLIFSIFRIPIM